MKSMHGSRARAHCRELVARSFTPIVPELGRREIVESWMYILRMVDGIRCG